MKPKIIHGLAAVCCLLGIWTVMAYMKTPVQWGMVLLWAALAAALYLPPNRAVRVFFYALFGLSAGIGITASVYRFLLWLMPICDENGRHCGMPMVHLFYGTLAACILTPVLLYAYAKQTGRRHEHSTAGILLAAAILCGAADWLDMI